MTHPESDWVDCLTTAELRAIWEPEQPRRDSWADVRAGLPPTSPSSSTGRARTPAPTTTSRPRSTARRAPRGPTSRRRRTTTRSSKASPATRASLAYFGLAYVEENAGLSKGARRRLRRRLRSRRRARRSRPATYAPLARVEFVYVSVPAVERSPALDAFVRFYLSTASSLAAEVGAVPLSDAGYRLASRALRRADDGVGVRRPYRLARRRRPRPGRPARPDAMTAPPSPADQRGAVPVPGGGAGRSFAGNVSRSPTEKAVGWALAACALVTVATTVGIVGVLVWETVGFFPPGLAGRVLRAGGVDAALCRRLSSASGRS